MIDIHQIAKEVSEKTNIKLSIIERILRFQWKFLKQQMESGEFKTVKIKYLGKFAENGKRKYYYDKGILKKHLIDGFEAHRNNSRLDKCSTKEV